MSDALRLPTLQEITETMQELESWDNPPEDEVESSDGEVEQEGLEAR